MKTLNMLGLSVLMSLVLASCYPEGAEYVDEMDTALTHYDENTDFTAFRTFVMPDSIAYICPESEAATLHRQQDSVILSLVARHFEDRHFIRLSEEEVDAQQQKPDFVLTVSAFSNAYYYYEHGYSWYDYWGWYPGWNWFNWNGPWSSYYPWYPWQWGGWYHAYNTGTLTIEMLNPDAASEDSKHIPVVWSGIINGILAGSPSYLYQRLEKNISACFTQSPYLKTTVTETSKP